MDPCEEGLPHGLGFEGCFANASLALRPKDLPIACLVGDNAYFFTTPWLDVTTTCIIQTIKVTLLV